MLGTTDPIVPDGQAGSRDPPRRARVVQRHERARRPPRPQPGRAISPCYPRWVPPRKLPLLDERMTRRRFCRVATAGAAALALPGCRTSAIPTDPPPDFAPPRDLAMPDLSTPDLTTPP